MRRCGAGCEGAGQVEGRLVKLAKLVARAAEALAEVHRVRAVADEAGGCRGGGEVAGMMHQAGD